MPVAESEPFALGDTTVTPIPLDAENAHAFLFEGDGKRVLVAMDETHGWTPPDLGPLDLAVLPIGVFEHHPYTGERLIPEEFCKPPVKKTRYGQALEHAARARRRGAPSSRTSRRWTGSRTTSSSGSARPTAGSPPATASSSNLDAECAPSD